jgi:hypothetical protein
MRKRLLPVGIVLLLAVPLVLVLRDLAREVIVVPLLHLLWVGDLYFQSIPQALFWALFSMVALIIAARSLVRDKKPARKKRQTETVGEGQVQVLTRWIRYAAQGGYSKWWLAQHLGELTCEVLAYRERITPGQMREQLRDGDLDAPPEVRAFLQAGLTLTFSRSVSLFSRLRRRLRSSVQTSAPDADLERVVQYLEDRLEAQYDH